MKQEIATTTTPNIEAALLTKHLASRNTEERESAQQVLKQMSLETLLPMLEQEAQKRKCKLRRMKILFGVYGGTVLLLLLIFALRGGDHWSQFPWQLFQMFSILTPVIAVAAGATLHKNATEVLAKQEDVRAVGPLAEALSLQDKNVYAIAAGALIRLLPRMQASDATLLNDDQRACLHRQLKGKNTELIQAILKAFEQVGDSKAIPFVEKLSEGEGAAAKDRRIREAAIVCMPFLQAQAERERAARTLLRAASSPDDPSTLLLRPAQGVTEVDASRLLRPSVPETAQNAMEVDASHLLQSSAPETVQDTRL